MSCFNVIMSKDSEMELRNIHSYIANTLLAPETAVKQTRRIINAIKELSNMPMRFSLYEEESWRSTGVRKRPIDNFIIFYCPNEKTKEVIILHIFYSGQDIKNIFKI